MDRERRVAALLLMGGSGIRFGSSLPKQFHRLAGKKIYLHTLEAFLSSGFFEEIILSCHQGWIAEVEQDLAPLQNPAIRVVAGGTTRQESSYLGLLACSPRIDIVVIHDAVRPFVSREIIEKNIEAALRFQAANTCIPSSDTIVHSVEGNKINSIPTRSEYLRGQTPQSFSLPLILAAHREAAEKKQLHFSDDCRLLVEKGHSVPIVSGSEDNIKITTELDIFLAEQIFRMRKQPLHGNDCAGSLEGKRFAVVGGTGGIGKWICLLLEEERALPIAIARNTHHFSCDLTKKSTIRQAFTKIFDLYGPLDGVINAAGFLMLKPFDKLKIREMEELLAVNFTGLLHVCKAAKIKSGGHIVNIASSSFSRGRKHYGIYSSSKAAVVNFTQSLAEERPDLRVNVLVPQRTNTSMRLSNFPAEKSEELLSPRKVAESVIHLLKNQSLSGAIIEVRQDIK